MKEKFMTIKNVCMSIAILLSLGLCARVEANNVAVSNVSLTGLTNSPSSKTAQVTFNISWENSWNNATNHDAAWVFIKYSSDGVNWFHAKLATSGVNPSGFSAGTLTGSDTAAETMQVYVSADKVGAYIEGTSTGFGYGTTSSQNVTLIWDWKASNTANGTSVDTASTIQIKVFAIEMVYVPGADTVRGTSGFNFSVGDGSSVQVRQRLDVFPRHGLA